MFVHVCSWKSGVGRKQRKTRKPTPCHRGDREAHREVKVSNVARQTLGKPHMLGGCLACQRLDRNPARRFANPLPCNIGRWLLDASWVNVHSSRPQRALCNISNQRPDHQPKSPSCESIANSQTNHLCQLPHSAHLPNCTDQVWILSPEQSPLPLLSARERRRQDRACNIPNPDPRPSHPSSLSAQPWPSPGRPPQQLHLLFMQR
jgi:hypothetical protein